MNRRSLLTGLLLFAGMGAVRAHTPYGQWVVYRKKHLLIGAHKTDPKTYEIAKKLVGVLATELPDAKSRVARAPTVERIASLMGTNQLDVAILNHEDAISMRDGSGRFVPYGPVAIRQLAILNSYVLVAHKRVPDRHTWLVVEALHTGGIIDKMEQKIKPVIEWHPGSLTYMQSQPQPAHD